MAALAGVFLLAHLADLPTTFADLDAINFALGVQSYDVAKHQPHPPGYPLFIAAAKTSTAVLDAIGVAAPEVRGLSVLSALSGALLIPLLFLLCRAFMPDERAAAWAAVATAVSPLFWFNSLRPLSDMTGLAAAVAAQMLLACVILGRPASARTARWLIAAALLTGMAIGIRSQNFVLTLPLLGLALVIPRSGLRERDRLGALAVLIIGILVWAVPMLVVSGGLEAYLAALESQAGEDFSGVVMLWTSRSPRVAANAIAYSFLWPWGTLVAGGIVIALALAGACRMLVRAPASMGTLLVAFGPYAVFHLLFHETVTTRYALPLVVPVALLAVHAVAGLGRTALHAGGLALIVWSLAITVPPSRAYAASIAPPVRAIQDAFAESSRGTVVAMHAVMLRTAQWYGADSPARVIRRMHARELAGLVDFWRREPDQTVSFVADPRRSDLAMLDPRARELTRSYQWSFPEMPLMGGVRPSAAQLFTLRPPGWMLGPGWAVTAEVGGQTAHLGAGPLQRPAIAWVRARAGAAMLMIGGRDFGPAAATISIASGGRVIDTFDAQPGFFFELRPLSAGILAASDAYLPIEVTASAAGGQITQVDLEQFDLQSEGVPMAGAARGWYEPEYNPGTGRTWRWMSERATLWVRSIGRDVTLTISGESPLRYFPMPPELTVTVGGQKVGQLEPASDFTWNVTIPAGLLQSANEEVIIRSDMSFVPGSGDQRSLALRVYTVSVN